MKSVDKPRVLAATTLIGDSVRNAAGENLGKIEDLVIDIDTGQVAYAVLSFGGFLGMGNKLFAVPWEALEVDFEDRKFVLDAEPETLRNAPGFDKDTWPDIADRNWGAEVHSHYGYRPYWESE